MVHHPQVDLFIADAGQWRAPMQLLRNIALDCLLQEDFKWGVPVYKHNGKNIIGFAGMKETCSLAFFKGALLSDPEQILARPGQESQSGRWVKFKTAREVVRLEPVLKAYIFEAIAIEEAGLKVPKKSVSEYPVPLEFAELLADDPALKTAFERLTPGRRRGYLLYFAEAKQSATRKSRIEKCYKDILAGRGLSGR